MIWYQCGQLNTLSVYNWVMPQASVDKSQVYAGEDEWQGFVHSVKPPLQQQTLYVSISVFTDLYERFLSPFLVHTHFKIRLEHVNSGYTSM